MTTTTKSPKYSLYNEFKIQFYYESTEYMCRLCLDMITLRLVCMKAKQTSYKKNLQVGLAFVIDIESLFNKLSAQLPNYIRFDILQLIKHSSSH